MNSLKILRNINVPKGQGIIRISNDNSKYYKLNSEKIVKGSIVTRGEALAEDMSSFRNTDLDFKSHNIKDSW